MMQANSNYSSRLEFAREFARIVFSEEISSNFVFRSFEIARVYVIS